jgi:hypothetical protein
MRGVRVFGALQRVMELDIEVNEDEFHCWRKYDAQVESKER